jgi:hypothetical protein
VSSGEGEGEEALCAYRAALARRRAAHAGRASRRRLSAPRRLDAMAHATRITVTISRQTKDELDRFAGRHGLDHDLLVEQALLCFMQARDDLPHEACIPTRIVLDDDAFDRVATRLTEPAPPTDALRELLRSEID